MPAGRPSEYTLKTGDEICRRLIGGESMRSITCCDTMPHITTIYRWIRNYPEFRKQYEQAREDQIDTFADEMADIADDGTNDYMTRTNKDGSEYEVVNSEHIQRSRLRVDTRKWIAERMKPQKYGIKQEVKHSGEIKGQGTTIQIVQNKDGIQSYEEANGSASTPDGQKG